MDSTLLEQIRHLCRDRAAYEHLKAILLQQERVHQLGWEKQYEKLISAQSSDPNSDDPNSNDTNSNDILSNIIAREKALAQLADAIQRSPSLELVLQIAVQVAQKLLQVDRVAIFRCHPDGRGEFVADAIASGLISLADMPERQLSLARHMIESTDPEHSAQTIDSIRTSSLSAHIVTLLQQIGISSYAANKIYAGQEVWGTLVAFHGSAYHSWTESDRTSLSLIAAQIGIAISLANLRQQSQELTDDLEILRIELGHLQQIVVDIVESKTDLDVMPDVMQTTEQINEEINEQINQDVVEDNQEDPIASEDLEPDNLEVSQVEQDLDEEESQSEAIIKEVQEIADFQNIPISENELSPLFLVPEPNILSDENKDDDLKPDLDENITPDELTINFTQADISYVTMPDNLKVISVDELEEITVDKETSKPESNEPESNKIKPELDEIKLELNEIELELNEIGIELNEIELDELKKSELDLSESTSPESEISGLKNIESESLNSRLSSTENLESVEPEQDEILPEVAEPEIVESQVSEMEDFDPCTSNLEANVEELAPELIEESELIEPLSIEPEIIAPDLIQQEVSQTIESEVEQYHNYQSDLDDDEPAIEPQFMETILEIAGNDRKATEFLLNVIDSYLEDAPHLVQVIDKALAVNDHARLLQSLNTLRSSSDYIGALTLSYQCRQLESAVKANYVVLIYACLSRVAIEVQRATDALRIARSRYTL